jgi:hypothetical protein
MAMWEKCGYKPHSGQRQVHASEKRILVSACGTRWGKSLYGAAEIISVLLTPGTHTWIVVPSYQYVWVWQWMMGMLTNLGVVPGMVSKLNEQTTRSAGYLELSNGSWVMVKSADRPNGLLGAELDLCVVDEAAKIPALIYQRYLRGRLVSRQGRLIIPSTPSGATGWVRELFDQGVEQEANNWEGVPWGESIQCWQLPTWHNPYVDMGEVRASKRQLPELVFDEQFRAHFNRLAGRIYPEFMWDTHIKSELPEGWENWPRWRGLDFGWTNPAACLFVALQPGTRTWWVLGEIYGSQLQYHELATLIREHPLSHPANRMVGTIADSEDPQGHAALTSFGVPVSNEVSRIQGSEHKDGDTTDKGQVKLDKSVFNGLMTVKAKLKGEGDGPRLVFASPEAFEANPFFMHRFNAYLDRADVKAALDSKFRDAPFIGPGVTNLLYEMDNYVWAEQDDHSLDKPALNQLDHTLDSLRYVLHTLDPLEGPAFTPAGGGGVYGDVSNSRGTRNGHPDRLRRGGRKFSKPGSWARRYR